MSNKAKISKRAAVVGVGLVVGVSTVGLAVAHAGSNAEPPENAGDLSQIYQSLTPAEREANAASQRSPEGQAMIRDLYKSAESGRMRVVNGEGQSGYMSIEAFDDSSVAVTVADLYPVTNEAGEIIAYYGGGGLDVPKALVDSGEPIDFQALKAAQDARVHPQPSN
jgi:hypothetical protein